MEPVNPLLPALQPDTLGLLRRAGGMINIVRGIQQEASAEYWYGLAMAPRADSEIRMAYAAKSEGLLRREVAAICEVLTNEIGNYKYQPINSEIRGYYFHAKNFYNDNQSIISRLHECYMYLGNLANSYAVKADTWIELAELLKAYILPELASKCYVSSFACENRLQTVIEERKLHPNYWIGSRESSSYGKILNLEETIERFPDYPDSYYSRSLKNSREGRYEAALNDLNICFSLSADVGVEFYRDRGRLHYQLGNTFAAHQDAANVLRLGGKMGAYLDGDWKDPDDPPF